jgi:transcriptional regulator GlxA family with amidase domain
LDNDRVELAKGSISLDHLNRSPFTLLMSASAQPRTVKVAILAFKSFSTIPITGPMDVLNESCEIQRRAHVGETNRTTFDIELVSLTGKPLHFDNGVTLRPDASLSTASKPDLILIPSLGPEVLKSLRAVVGFIPWIRECAAHGARAASVCTGAFLLAESGLLDGREATTHWFFADLFRQHFPRVDLLVDRLIVDEGSVITCGAALSFLDLALYLIDLYCGHDAAVLSAKIMLIDMGRHTQLPYTIFSQHKTHNDRQILRAQRLMEQKPTSEVTIASLARGAGMSVRNFDRRFRTTVGEAPSTYLQRLRIERVKRLLETTNDSIEEIMLTVGYQDVRSFRRLFHAFTDLTPKGYRQKYGAQPRQGGLELVRRRKRG